MNSSRQITGAESILVEDGSATDNPAGLEFSPNGDYLYFSFNNSSSNVNLGNINYIDLTQTSLSVTKFLDDTDFGNAGIELGYDGIMYFASADYLGALTSPNNPNISNWDPQNIAINIPLHHEGASGYQANAYHLPDQIDQQNYEEIVHPVYNEISYTVQSSTTWTPANNPFTNGSNTVYIKDELIIPDGVSLTITDMTFKFGEDARVLVMSSILGNSGGRLTLKNTILTSNDRCGNTVMWEGIQVQGNPFVSQYSTPNPHGRLIVTNQSLIENAKTAIRAGTGKYNSIMYNGKSSGGIVYGLNSSFRNNLRDVHIDNYLLSNRALFTNCTFFVDDDPNLLGATYKEFIKLDLVKSVDFKYCTFEGNDFYKNGIISNTANFKVNNSNFNNLNYGIRAITTNNMYSVIIEENDFNYNVHGAYLSGMDYASIVANDFTMSSYYINGLPWADMYGLYLEGCSKYEVENNYFKDEGNANSVGIYINRSNGKSNFKDENEIYNNTFEELQLGTSALDQNDDNNNDKAYGLQILCGTYLNGFRDIAVDEDPNVGAPGSIRDVQGICGFKMENGQVIGLQAGNIFTNNCGTPSLENDYYGGDWKHDLDYNYDNLSPDQTEPICYDQQMVNSNQCDQIAEDWETCPDNQERCDPCTFCPPCDILIGQLNFHKGEKEGLLGEIDDGDTDALLQVIDQQNAVNIYSALMDASPYLSDEVLLALLGFYPDINEDSLADILLANAPVTDTVWNTILALTPALNADIMDDLEDAQTGGPSARYSLLSEAYYHGAKAEYYTSEIIRDFLFNDTISQRGMDSAIVWLQQAGRKDNLVMAYLYNGYFSQADDLIVTLPEVQFADYIELAGLIHHYATDTLSDSLTAEHIDLLYDLADVQKGTKVAYNAQAWLSAETDTLFQESMPMPTDETGKRSRYGQQEKEDMEQTEGFVVYPNPTDGLLHLAFDQPVPCKYVYIYDINGKMIAFRDIEAKEKQLVMDWTEFPQGVYLVQLIGAEGNILATQRVIKQDQ